jgi:hypothetical protein
MTELLTHSRMTAFKTCRRLHQFQYIRGLRRDIDSKPLRQGSAFHAGVEVLGNGGSVEEATAAAYGAYGDCPEGLDQYEWDIEAQTVACLVSAYQWRWEGHQLEHVAVERSFELPLLNPETGRKTPSFNLAGKIDAIVKMEDGRLLVKETKLFADDIGPDSDLWRRMRMDQQVSLYLLAARRLGFDCAGVLYDVARKPTIKPNPVPVLDELGVKVVLDQSGNRVRTENKKTWRQTSDTERGYVLQTRQMTVDEWGERLTTDIGERPTYYFHRQEIPRLEKDLEAFGYEVWDVAQEIRSAQKNNRHYRTVGKQTCPWCSFYNFCSQGIELDGVAPAGFYYASDKHPELGRNHDNSSTSSTEETCATAAQSERSQSGESYW